MLTYIRKRLVGFIFVIIGVTLLSFILSNISEIDPAEAYMRRISQTATEEEVQAYREEMGYDLPIHKQYLKWVSKAIRFDFGISLTEENSVSSEIMSRFPATLKLIGLTLLIIVLVSIPLGILCAYYKDSIFDHLIRGITIIGISVPGFWLGFMLLYLFAVKLELVPIVTHGDTRYILLPAFTLAFSTMSSSVRLLRSNVLENMNMDYVVYAKARGISYKRIMWRHILKNALPPMITLFGQGIGFLIGGTVIVENVFAWPGLGDFAIKAIISRDLPFISAYVLLIAVVFVVCNLIADILNMIINPKLLKGSGDL